MTSPCSYNNLHKIELDIQVFVLCLQGFEEHLQFWKEVSATYISYSPFYNHSFVLRFVVIIWL